VNNYCEQLGKSEQAFANLDREPLFSALYGMYAIIMNEMKAALKVGAKAEQTEAVNKCNCLYVEPRVLKGSTTCCDTCCCGLVVGTSVACSSPCLTLYIPPYVVGASKKFLYLQ
jgi:hypothetical protein